jgi:U3 small nucleolar RNA-associated protein 16
MAAKRTPKNAAKKTKKSKQQAEVIELSSDSEPDVPASEKRAPESVKEPSSSRKYTQKDYDEMPLLKVEGIKYDVHPTTEKYEAPTSESKPAKLPVRVKDTGSARHRHVSIEIPLMSSSLFAKNVKSQEAPGSEDAQEEDVFKTPMERRHITFNDSDNEEFVSPLEAPLRNPLEAGQATKEVEIEEEQEEDEDSDDEAPEAISSHAAGAHLAKVSQAATKAAQK